MNRKLLRPPLAWLVVRLFAVPLPDPVKSHQGRQNSLPALLSIIKNPNVNCWSHLKSLLTTLLYAYFDFELLHWNPSSGDHIPVLRKNEI